MSDVRTFFQQANPENYEEHIEALTKHMIQAEKQGNYVAADQDQTNIQKLKIILLRTNKKQMKERHNHEIKEKEKQDENELNECKHHYEQKKMHQTQQFNKSQQSMKNRHKEEKRSFRQQYERTTPIKCKESSELLNLRKIEEQMAKQRNYKNAHQIQVKVQIMQKQQNSRWLQIRATKLNNLVKKMQQRHAHQLQILEARYNRIYQQTNKQYQKDLTRLNHKHLILNKQFNNRHQRQILDLQHKFTNKGNEKMRQCKLIHNMIISRLQNK